MQVEAKKPLTLNERYPHVNVHRSLLVATAGLAIASVIPGSRQIASLILRSAAVVSSTAICADSWEKSDVYNRTFNITRIGVVVLGIVGAATAKPALFVASLAAEVALQTFEVMKAIYDQDTERALRHSATLVVDTLMLAAGATGMWQLMVTAAVVNSFVMLIFMACSEDPIENMCYFVLIGTSVASAILTSKIIREERSVAHFEIKNKKSSVMQVFNSDIERVTTVQPGEKVVLDFPYRRGHTKVMYGVNLEGGWPYKKTFYATYKYKTIILQPAMNPKFYPTVPVGGTIVVDKK